MCRYGGVFNILTAYACQGNWLIIVGSVLNLNTEIIKAFFQLVGSFP